MNIRVGPVIYELIEEHNLHGSKDLLYGVVDCDECVIKLRENMNVQLKRVTFWHEVTHLLLAQIGKDELGKDEDLIDALANVLVGLFIDNPGISELYAEDADEETA